MRLIIFDLDGVLIEAKKIHYEALNAALGKDYEISWQDHLTRYDGLKTFSKLEMLTKERDLPKDSHTTIWREKQRITIDMFRRVKPDERLVYIMSELSKHYKLAVCSNSIRNTTITALERLGLLSFFDVVFSNEDVKNCKPHPEMYWKAMSEIGSLPEETLIVEDSPYGLLAAARSNANVLRVNSPEEVTLEKIQNSMGKKISNKWVDKKLNVLIPMAGAGTRFEKAGYTFPKPLVSVGKKPMIQVVVENINIDANFIFVVQKNHRKRYNLDSLLGLVVDNPIIVEVDGLTEGAACTALLAREYINNDQPLFFANSDQFVEWDSNEFMYKMSETQCDGGIAVFESTHPKWSFAKVENGLVVEVAEKNPISTKATVGYYFWKKGSDFVKYADSMINKNIRVNNEFYVCPVFNEAIKDGKTILPYEVGAMWGLGTPEDLQYFLNENNI